MLAQLYRYPVSIFGVVAAVAVFACPAATELLQLDFAAVARGEVWRVITGHWTHFDGSHLFWDLTMFAGLSVLCEQRAGKWYGGLLAVMAVVVSTGVWGFCPEIVSYRGLSGLDTGLFCWLAVDRTVQAVRRRDWAFSGVSVALMLGLGAKLAFEWSTGKTLFVAEGDFQPLVQSHAVGALVGILFGAGASTGQKTGLRL